MECREVLDVVEVQAVPTHEGLDSRARVVAVVLVVDGVELDVLDQIADVWVLHGQEAAVGEEVGQSGNEVVEVRDVGHHVVGDEHVGRTVFGADRHRGTEAEEVADRRYADRFGRPCRTGRGLDADGGDPRCHEVAEQVPIVAGDLDGQRLRPEVTGLDEGGDVRGGVGHEGVGERRVVRVLLVEDRLGGQRVRELHERAIRAEDDRQREPGLGVCELLRIDEGVGNRRRPEVEHRPQARASARAALADPAVAHRALPRVATSPPTVVRRCVAMGASMPTAIGLTNRRGANRRSTAGADVPSVVDFVIVSGWRVLG